MSDKLAMHMSAPRPENEQQRLAALRSYNILDTDPQESFDRLTRLAKRLLDVPIAVVSLVDEDRQWFKSIIGLDATETHRDVAFCAHTIMDSPVMVVNDACLDTRFAENPLVTGAPHIRFYAGAPLVTAEGFRLGTLCVISDVPRDEFSDDDQAVLADLAGIVVQQLEMHRALGGNLALMSGPRSDELVVDQRVLYQAFFDQVTAQFGILDRAGHVMRATKSWCASMGISDLPNIPARLFDLVPSAPDAWRDALSQCLDNDETLSGEHEITLADGAPRWFAWDMAPWRLAESGPAAGVFLAVVDVTLRRKAQAEAAAAAQGARDIMALADDSPDPILWVTIDGEVLYANAAARHFIDATGTSSTGFQDSLLRRAIDESLRENRPVEYQESLADTVYSVIVSADTSSRCANVYARDVTADLEAEQRLAQSEKLATLGRISSGIAHEMNQPLNNIRLTAEIAQSRLEDDPTNIADCIDSLQIINEQVDRMAVIADHMQAFARADDGNDRPTPVRSCVDGALVLLNSALVNADISVVRRGEASACKFSGSRVRLEQVIINLLSNARDSIVDRRKAEPQGSFVGQVSVDLSEDPAENEATITITDNGVGIPSDVLKKIFDPFFTTKEVGAGTGLGLSISYAIIESLGGTLRAVHADEGARFEITLPTVTD